MRISEPLNQIVNEPINLALNGQTAEAVDKITQQSGATAKEVTYTVDVGQKERALRPLRPARIRQVPRQMSCCHWLYLR